jgi:16S rRNA (cytidine1402-2'-O)-methyltransferase
MNKGKLYIVPTPIGNLKDITLRALEVLNKVHIVAAEDTRQTLKLLNHYNIKKSLISYHKFNELNKSSELVNIIEKGKNVALVSDAGTPGISDPGEILIKKCIENNIEIEVLPGATAITTALVHSGLDTTKFIFIGFLPRDSKNKNSIIESLKDRMETLIFYESPHRLLATLEFLKDTLGNRKIAICRELTKLHEEIKREYLEESINFYKVNSPKGEYVLVLEGKSYKDILEEKKREWENLDIAEHIKKYIYEKKLSKKEAIKKVAKDRNLPKSKVYKHSIHIE